MTLRERLRTIDPARPALRSPRGESTLGDLLDAGGRLTGALADARVSIRSPGVEQALAGVVAADGVARSIVLVSPLLDSLDAGSIESQAGAQVRVGDFGVVRLDGEGASRPAPARQSAAGTAWILATSGTTGPAKLVAHTLASLTRTTRDDTARGRGQVWGLLYDYTRFAGLQVVLQSLLSGACLAAPSPSDPLARQLRFLVDAGCTHLSATPTLWRKILMTPGGDELALAQVTLGGEIADDTILNRLSAVYPRARISHVYASTEAGVGFSVKDSRAGFPASYLESPPQGVALRVVEGILQVANRTVSAAYLGDRGTFARDGWVDTGDRVEVVGDRVRFLGRANGVINVGGNKVHPEVVEHELLAHPSVSMARVGGKANPIMGSLVVADVVPVEGAAASLDVELLAYLRERLERHMVPVSIRIVPTLDYGPAGKVVRAPA